MGEGDRIGAVDENEGKQGSPHVGGGNVEDSSLNFREFPPEGGPFCRERATV